MLSRDDDFAFIKHAIYRGILTELKRLGTY